MVRCVMVGTLVLFGMSAGALDIDQYEILRERPNERSNSWYAILHFKDTDIHVPLCRGGYSTPSGPGDRDVVAPDEFPIEIEWLDTDRLLWLHWITAPEGNGAYRWAGHIIVRVRDGRAWELHRAWYSATGRYGGGCHYKCSVEFAYNSATGLLTENAEEESAHLGFEPFPLAVPLGTADEPAGYQRKVRIVQRAEYRPTPSCLRECGRVLTLELGEKSFPLGEVAQYLVLLVVPRYGRSPEVAPGELAHMEEQLRVDNQALRDSETCTGSIKLRILGHSAIRPLPPYVEECGW